ncbi:hypothetical protein BDV93DRAFT_252285 [Ceratobasidium sp. AG-I]|nr:hypothetical protein BDV93DRAFT_252285 [Ceratobasidium sp. AG-I]
MCGTDSADARVQASVRQIVQLMSTIDSANTLDRHFLMPCLIAGAAARHESHRKTIRTTLQRLKGRKLWVMSGEDLMSILDHLWHGAGAGGRPTRWDDYANSRSIALPIPV